MLEEEVILVIADPDQRDYYRKEDSKKILVHLFYHCKRTLEHNEPNVP